MKEDVLALKSGRHHVLYCSRTCALRDGAVPERHITQEEYEQMREQGTVGALCPRCDREYHSF